jgi:hypothetical protein
MPYSITTKDGITINNIPDDMPADAPELKQRVATIRGQRPAAAPAAPALPKVDAPTSGVAMGMRDPIDAGAQMLRRIVPEGVGRAVDNMGNWLADKGLPVARSTGVQGVDNIVKGVNQGYDTQRGEQGFDWGRLGGNMVNPVNYAGGGLLKGASTVGQLARGGAMTAGISALFQPVVDTADGFWSQKAGQAALGAATGGVLTPVVAKAGQGLAKGAQALTTPTPARNVFTPEGVTIRVNNILQSQGMNLQDAPDVILQSVRRQVEEAGRTGARLDPAAMLRRAQFEAVGLTDDAAPTLGQMTRDPMQFANEKNLSGIQLDRGGRGVGNDLAERFQRQNQRLGEVFDNMGARDATDRVTAGQSFMDALRAADAPVKAGVDDLYATGRAMNNGRAADLERGFFSNKANADLDQGMWGAFVPPEIRTLLNTISEGKTPFNVDAVEQIDTILAASQRSFPSKSPQASAIGVIRNALRETPLSPVNRAAPAAGMADDMGRAAGDVFDEGVTDVVPRMAPELPAPPSTALSAGVEFPDMPQPGTAMGAAMVPPAPPINDGEAAREAFRQARRAAASRFATIDETPALKAALDNEAPDSFVRNFILNADVGDVQSMRNVLQNSPDALAQARAQVADHLKRAAFGENPSGDKAFTADRYLNTVRAIGRQKLEVFFTPAEIVRLNLAGKVASDINSIPVGAKYGTNTSGTGAAVMNMLSSLSRRTLDKVPVVGQVAGLIADKAGSMRTERAIGQALSPVPTQPARELSPEVVRALELLFPAGGVAGGVLGGSSIN